MLSANVGFILTLESFHFYALKVMILGAYFLQKWYFVTFGKQAARNVIRQHSMG